MEMEDLGEEQPSVQTHSEHSSEDTSDGEETPERTIVVKHIHPLHPEVAALLAVDIDTHRQTWEAQWNARKDAFFAKLEAELEEARATRAHKIEERGRAAVGDVPRLVTLPLTEAQQQFPKANLVDGCGASSSDSQASNRVSVTPADQPQSRQTFVCLTVAELPRFDPLPRQLGWRYLTHNVRATDQGRCMYYTDEQGETVPAVEGKATQLIGSIFGTDKAREDFVLKHVLPKYGCSDSVVAGIAQYMHVDFVALVEYINQYFTHPLVEPDAHLRNGMEGLIETLDKHWCRCCLAFDCDLHGNGAAPYEDLTAFCRQRADAHRLLPLAPKPDKACGANCYVLGLKSAPVGPEAAAESGTAAAAAAATVTASNAAATDATVPDVTAADATAADATAADATAAEPPQNGVDSTPWSKFEEDEFTNARALFGNNPCALARMISTRTCKEVYLRLYQPDADYPVITVHTRKPRKPRKAMGGSKPKQRLPVAARRQKRIDKKRDFSQYVPCSCEGDCSYNDKCPCFSSDNYCEKFCTCSKNCNNRFLGCSCKGGCKRVAADSTTGCPCIAADRECDPDLCHSCCAKACGSQIDDKDNDCQNMNLRLRRSKKVLLGLSAVAGYGCFLRDGAQAHEYIGEYTGEYITQEEADRRGQIYDKVDNSYLFDLNEDFVIDARTAGNKLRFANHSPTPNCYAKKLMVDGQHKIAIFAHRDICPMEEIFYDYKYKEDVAPGWAQGRKRGQGRGKGVGASKKQVHSDDDDDEAGDEHDDEDLGF